MGIIHGNRRNGQRGSTLVAVLCVLMIVEVLCLSLHFAVSSLSASVQRTRQKNQCRLMAVSCLDCLEAELLNPPEVSLVSAPEAFSMSVPEGFSVPAPEASSVSEGVSVSAREGSLVYGSLWEYLEAHKEGWEGERTFRAELPSTEWPGEAGSLEICLFWDIVSEEAVLCVEITAACKSQSFGVRRIYHQKQEAGVTVWQR